MFPPFCGHTTSAPDKGFDGTPPRLSKGTEIPKTRTS